MKYYSDGYWGMIIGNNLSIQNEDGWNSYYSNIHFEDLTICHVFTLTFEEYI